MGHSMKIDYLCNEWENEAAAPNPPAIAPDALGIALEYSAEAGTQAPPPSTSAAGSVSHSVSSPNNTSISAVSTIPTSPVGTLASPAVPTISAASTSQSFPAATNESQDVSRANARPRNPLPSKRPTPMTQGFHPINGRLRDLVPSAPAPAPVSAPRPQTSQTATQRVLCICTACSGNGSGKLVAPKTKKEHEHADRIERDGVRVDDEAKCQRCRAANLDCFKRHGNSIVCGNCVRHKERCSWNGQSMRKRDAARRQNQAALAAQRGQQGAETPAANGDGGAALQEQPAPCNTNGMRAADQLSLGGVGKTGGEQPTPNSGEENREGTSSRSPSGSQTADETECPQPPRKRQRKNSPAPGPTA